jgi:hypothetical protein
MDRERFAMALPRRIRIFFIVTGLAVFWAGNVAAQSDIYTVRDVAVDVTGDTATEARAAAVPEAYRTAFSQLVERLVPRGERSYVPQLDSARLEQMVRDFEVEEERASAVRYIAELTVRFQPSEVQRVLREAGVRYAVTRSKPVIVLPVYEAGSTSVLWDEPNPWRQAWSEYPSDAGLVPMIVPLGDLSDMASINASQAVAGNRDSMASVATNYGAEGALVAQAQLSGDPEVGSARIDVVSRWYDLTGGSAGQQVSQSLRQREGEDLEDLLYRGAASVSQEINESWKQANLLSFDQQQIIIAQVPLDGLQRWQQVRSRLSGISMIDAVKLRELNRRYALVEVFFFGDPGQLQLALSQRDLSLSSDPDMGVWLISASGYSGDSTGGVAPSMTDDAFMQDDAASGGGYGSGSGTGTSEDE